MTKDLEHFLILLLICEVSVQELCPFLLFIIMFVIITVYLFVGINLIPYTEIN